jgi:hypothetical protein
MLGNYKNLMALFRNFHERHLMMKGYVLYATIEIERKIDDLLSLYFCNTEVKQNEIKEFIFYHERVTFDFKRELFNLLAKKYYVDWIEKQPDILRTLENITPHRNRFAHLEVSEGKELTEILAKPQLILQPDLTKMLSGSDKNTLVYKRYKNGKLQYIGYDTLEISRIETQVNYVSKALDNLRNTVAPNT